MRPPWKTSIRWQLILTVASMQALLMAIFVIGMVRQERETLLEGARRSASIQARQIAENSVQLVITNDVAAIEDVLGDLSLDKQIRFAMVTSPDGVVVAHTTPRLEGKLLSDQASAKVLRGPAVPMVYLENDSTFAAAAPIKMGNRVIGWAFVGRDVTDEHAYVQHVITTGLLYTLMAALVGTLVAMLVANRLLRPLKLLLAGAQRLAQDSLDQPVPLITRNEVGTVTTAFNSAMQRLAEQRNSLRKEVSDRVHAEHELHQIYGLSHRRAAELDAVIESLPQAVYIGTGHGVTKCNGRAMALLKVTSLAELNDLHVKHELMDAQTRQPLLLEQVPFQRALLGETPVMDLILAQRDTRQEIIIRVAAAPVFQYEKIVGAVSVATDVTVEKLEQEKLRRAKAEAEEANRAKDHFLAVLSHELRTPLTPVLTIAQMLERDPDLAEDARQDVIMIRRNVELEAQLIDDLLDLTRISRGKVELTFAAVDVHEKLRQIIGMCQMEAAAKQLQITTEFLADHRIVRGDVTRLQQVFWNLLRNAIKFTRPGDRIMLRTRNSPAATEIPQEAEIDAAPDLIIDVIDTGIGIEPEALRRVFDAFEQGGRETTRAFGGLGLGLTISKAMVDLHSGRITAASDGKDCGATFTVFLPSMSQPTVVENPVVAPAHAASNHKQTSGGRQTQILLVEDHPDTSRATARLLQQCGYQVQTAANVADGIRLARSQHFDLIISDIGLPDGTGHDLIRQLVAEAPLRGETVRGIAISGFGQPSDLQRSAEAGFVEHLVKPVTPEILLHAVDDALHVE